MGGRAGLLEELPIRPDRCVVFVIMGLCSSFRQRDADSGENDTEQECKNGGFHSDRLQNSFSFHGTPLTQTLVG